MIRRKPPEGDPLHEGLYSSSRDKYAHDKPAHDSARLRIDAIEDFIPRTLTARDVKVMVNEPAVASIEWTLINPNGRNVPGGFRTEPGDPDATTRPFPLSKDNFKDDVTYGLHYLMCTAYDATGRAILRADREFRVLKSDTHAAILSHGVLSFTEYRVLGALGNRSEIASGYDYQVDVKLEFLPNKSVDCDDVAMIQTVQPLNPDGTIGGGSVKAFSQRTTKAQWRIDTYRSDLSPYYIALTDASTGVTKDSPGGGKKGRGGEGRESTTLKDKPAGTTPSVDRFETCAVCRSGSNIGQVYGCGTWGYRTDDKDNVELMPRSYNDTPSRQFQEATAQWNIWAAKDPDRFPAPELKTP